MNLDDYEQVKDRISRFYSDHPDGSIRTDLISENPSAFGLFKASVFIGERLVSTGFAYEERNSTPREKGKSDPDYINRDSWVENCETSAIGRALANFNYCGNRRPSREEMQKVMRAETSDETICKEDETICKELVAELKINDELKKKLWDDSGRSMTQFRRLLEVRKAIWKSR